MTKIYIICTSSGVYEEEQETILFAVETKQQAEEIVKQFKEKFRSCPLARPEYTDYYGNEIDYDLYEKIKKKWMNWFKKNVYKEYFDRFDDCDYSEFYYKELELRKE